MMETRIVAMNTKRSFSMAFPTGSGEMFVLEIEKRTRFQNIT